jgi:hypothetical protein
MQNHFAIKGCASVPIADVPQPRTDWRDLAFRGFAGGTLGAVGLWLPYEYSTLRA